MWRHSRDGVAGSSTDCMAAASWAEEAAIGTESNRCLHFAKEWVRVELLGEENTTMTPFNEKIPLQHQDTYHHLVLCAGGASIAGPGGGGRTQRVFPCCIPDESLL
jgi:hypothetical protein